MSNEKVVSVWNGETFSFAEEQKALADAEAGLLQVWKDGPEGWYPGYYLKQASEFQKPAAPAEVDEDEDEGEEE